jgi:hypothetical protein
MADWRTFLSGFRSAVSEIPSLVVLCADFRKVQMMSDEVVGALLDGLRQYNARIERSALMLPANAPTPRIQMERLLREAENVRRRVCADAADVKAWLSSSLDGAQQARLADFLASQ